MRCLYVRGNQRGGALLTVLVVTMVLIIMGTALLRYAGAVMSQVASAEARTKAYYVARSGTDAFVSYIVDNPDGLTSEQLDAVITDAIAAGTSGPTALGDGSFTITLTAGEADAVLVTAVGTVRGVTETVVRTIVLTPGGSTMPPLDCAVFSLNGITLEGSAWIKGHAGTNSEVKDSVNFAWSTGIDSDKVLWIGPGGAPSSVVKTRSGAPMDVYVKSDKVKNLPEPRDYPLPSFPDFPTPPYKGEFTAGWNPSPPYFITEATGDGWYSKLTVLSELNIYVGSGTRIIRADELAVTGSGKINIVGTGKLILYVNKFTLEGSGSINKNGSESQLHMYYSGDSKLSLGGDTKFRGSVYAKTASIDIGGSGGITGHIVTGGTQVNITGDATANVRVLYAPNAAVKLTGSGKVRGSLIGKSVHMEGGTFVEWQGIPDSQGEIKDFEKKPKGRARGLWK